jgi:uncharacterized protein YbcI
MAHSGPLPDRPHHEQPGEALTEPDFSGTADIESVGSMRAAISNAMVGLKKRYYGKGPEKARTYFGDNHVFCVLEGGLTPSERTLVDAGQERAVREFRLLFQETMTKPTTEAVEEITGRKVLGYHSQIVFEPTTGFEIFVLDGPPGG